MKSITLIVLIGCAVLTAGYVAPRIKNDKKFVDREFVLKQKVFFDVLRNIYANDDQTQYYKDAMAWKFEENFDKFTNVTGVKRFLQYYKFDVVKKQDIFSIMYEKHRNYAISLFNVFYYAKDWDTFYKSLVWTVYHNVNRDVIIYALTVAIIHRKDMNGFELPAPYEINPYFYFSIEVIEKAIMPKLNNFDGLKKVDGVFNKRYEVITSTNYTDEYLYSNVDQRLSYFTKDIGLNSYYYYFHADYPFWMGGEEFKLNKDRRGELYLFEHQQLLARYYMERLSNGLDEIPDFIISQPVEDGHYPNLRNFEGVHFPTRPMNFVYKNSKNNYDFNNIRDYYNHIREAIDYGYVTLPNGTHIDLSEPESIENLGNFIQGNPDWPYWRLSKYLPIYSQILLGSTMEQKSINQAKKAPSVLENFETAMRDPLFYMMYKRLLKPYWKFKNNLPSYTENELVYKGVKIESVEMDKLITYFNNHDVDITSAFKFGKINQEEYDQEDYLMKARQMRLNHVPFNFKINVNSEVADKSVVRVFLGPKYNEAGHLIGIDDMRKNFWLMDTFMYDLTVGQNAIERNSTDFPWFILDRVNFYIMREEVTDSLGGGTAKLMPFNMNSDQTHCGFPDRLMLPKGNKAGMPFQFFFVITPYTAPQFEQYSTYDEVICCGIGSGSRHIDALSMGYPFDRKIDELTWHTPNMYYFDTKIYHKDKW